MVLAVLRSRYERISKVDEYVSSRTKKEPISGQKKWHVHHAKSTSIVGYVKWAGLNFCKLLFESDEEKFGNLEIQKRPVKMSGSRQFYTAFHNDDSLCYSTRDFLHTSLHTITGAPPPDCAWLRVFLSAESSAVVWSMFANCFSVIWGSRSTEK